MCGRARLSSDVSEIKLVFSIPPQRPCPNFAPSWNVAPTDTLPVVCRDRETGERRLDLMRWGLVPYWAKDIKIGFSTINAKAEGIDTRPAFREAFQRRRCLVPLDRKIPSGGKVAPGFRRELVRWPKAHGKENCRICALLDFFTRSAGARREACLAAPTPRCFGAR
jgi:hypothetical protein